MAVPRWEPEEKWEAFEPTGETTVKTVTASPEEIVGNDGTSTLVLALRMGLRPKGDGQDGKLEDGDLYLAQALPTRFLAFLRDKDPDGVMRRHIASYLREVADDWESGSILEHAPSTTDIGGN